MVSTLGQRIAKEIQLEREESRELGLKEGIKAGKIEVAKNLIALGLDIEQIVKATQLPKEEIEKLIV